MGSLKWCRLFLAIMFTTSTVTGQYVFYKDRFYSPYTLDDEKSAARREKIISQANALATIPLTGDAATEEKISSALWSMSQFLVKTDESALGIQRLVKQYHSLSESTQRALLEVLYGIYPKEYYTEMVEIMQRSRHPKNFAMAASYVFRAYPTEAGKRLIRQAAASLGDGQSLMIYNVLRFIENYHEPVTLPDLDSLFSHQQVHKYKVIYSFQSKDRDVPGIAIVQNSDGSFVRSDSGRLSTFRQLARSASNLPWFISNGSTPQGLYTITGTGFSRNPFIGPTPNLQLAMMNEVNPPTFTHYFPIVFNAPPEKIYRSYFPENWQQWSGLMEAYDAGKIGRSEIIAHGTTVDPGWYTGKPYYPLTPSMGCLCAVETWDKKTGKIIKSDQLDLVNAFIATPGKQGYLIVIDVDDKQVTLDPATIDRLVSRYEKNKKEPGLFADQAVK